MPRSQPSAPTVNKPVTLPTIVAIPHQGPVMAQTGTVPGTIPLVNPTPHLPTPKVIITTPAAPIQKWRVVTGATIAIRGCNITLKPGDVLTEYDDLRTIRLGGVKLEKV